MPFSPQQMATYRKLLVSKGVCTSCMNVKTGPERITCRPCQDRINEKRAERRHRYRFLMLCTECGVQTTGPSYCGKHLALATKQALAKRSKRISEGRCIDCGGHNADAGFFRQCHSCGDPAKLLIKRIRAGR